MAVKKRLFFTIFRIVGLFLVGMVVAVFVALSRVNLETLRGNVLAVLQDATGMPVEIDGGVSWKFSLRPRIELNQVRVPNADWARHKYAFSAEKIDVTLNLISLFRDRPTIQNLKIYDATLCLEQNKDGKFSISPAKKTNQTVNASGDVVPAMYPFTDAGLGAIEIKNLAAHILGASYSLSGLSVRYMPMRDKREYAGWLKVQNDVLPFVASFSPYNAERRVYPMRVALATGGDALIANIALERNSRAPIDFIIKGDLPDLGAWGALLNIDLLDIPQAKVNIAGGYDWQKLTLRKSSVSVRGMNANFSGGIDWSGARPVITLNFDSKYVSLIKLFPGMYEHPSTYPDRPLNVFKDIPLFGNELKKFDLNLGLRIDNFVVYRDLSIDNIDLKLREDDGRARFDLGAVFAGGTVRIGADADIADDGRITMRVGATGHDVVIGKLLNQLNIRDIISDLPVNFDTYLVASGTDLSELMQTVTGPVRVYSSSSGYAHSRLVSYMYGTDFLTSLRHSIQDLFRSEKKYDQIKISCVAVNAKLRSGVVETRHGVAVETNAINVRLAGDVDLGQEKMQLALTTVPVRGIKLSLSGNVVNSMQISGELAEPDIQISGAAMAGRVASATGLGMLLAPFTGGIGLVAGAGVGLLAGDLLENWLADDNPCKTALERGAPVRRDDAEWLGMPVNDLIKTVLPD